MPDCRHDFHARPSRADHADGVAQRVNNAVFLKSTPNFSLAKTGLTGAEEEESRRATPPDPKPPQHFEDPNDRLLSSSEEEARSYLFVGK